VLPQKRRAAIDRSWGWRRRRYRNPHPLGVNLILAVDGQVAGYCDVGPARSTGRAEVTGELYAIYVDPDLIGTGVGARLIGAGRTALRGLGHSTAELWVLDSNERARRFYERDGWQLSDGIKLESIGGVDLNEVRYVREL